MKIHFVTLFPEMVLPATEHSILARAEAAGAVDFTATNPRDFAMDAHRTVDERPYGGGPGMVMMCEPLNDALQSMDTSGAAIIFFEPWGDPIKQDSVKALATRQKVVMVCGHYEGIDQRLVEKWATHTFSLGDFILTGGELPALVLADAIVRQLPGVLGSADSLEADSHADGLLGYPQYTRPPLFEDRPVPHVLLSGNHQEIAKYRRRQQLELTRTKRPDLFARAPLSKADLDLL